MTMYRDPDTGKFVAGPGPGWGPDLDDRGAVDVDAPEVFTGAIEYTLPAADLTSDDDSGSIESNNEILDWTRYLDSDEVFAAHSISLIVSLSTGQTATAEHTAEWEYQLRRDSELATSIVAADPAEAEVGIVDVDQDQSDEHDVIHSGQIVGSGDFADSGTSVGGGADTALNQHYVNYPAEALPPPAFDQDDELHLPARHQIRGSDDQAVYLRSVVTCRGVIYEL